MRILIGHNQYKMPGGEDAVVNTEHQLLKDFGEETYLYKRTNEEFDSLTVFQKMNYFRQLDWLPQTYREVRAILKKFKPDVAHFHNIFYAISPAAYSACKDEGIPVVQSQHNFRLLCLNGLLYRNGHICEECIDKPFWPGVVHGCFRGSRLLSVRAASLLNKHKTKRTWQEMVNIFITATQFGQQKLMKAGIDAERIVIKPNFVHPDPGIRTHDEGYALYVGRLSHEKGVKVLLEAWKSLAHIPLRIIGDGPLAETLKATVRNHNMRNVEFFGYVNQKKYEENMKGAKFLVVPSQCYENFPCIIVEAFARGVPVISSDIGTLKDLVQNDFTGLLFDSKSSNQLAEKANDLMMNSSKAREMGINARRTFEANYNAQRNYKILINIYQKAKKAAHQESCMNQGIGL